MKFLISFGSRFSQFGKEEITRELLDIIRNGDAVLFRVNDAGDFEKFNPSNLEFSAVEIYDFADHEEECQEIWATLVGKMIPAPAPVPGTFLSSP